jgi:hypothetical protein
MSTKAKFTVFLTKLVITYHLNPPYRYNRNCEIGGGLDQSMGDSGSTTRLASTWP